MRKVHPSWENALSVLAKAVCVAEGPAMTTTFLPNAPIQDTGPKRCHLSRPSLEPNRM